MIRILLFICIAVAVYSWNGFFAILCFFVVAVVLGILQNKRYITLPEYKPNPFFVGLKEGLNHLQTGSTNRRGRRKL
jgi:hypothetical protein